MWNKDELSTQEFTINLPITINQQLLVQLADAFFDLTCCLVSRHTPDEVNQSCWVLPFIDLVKRFCDRAEASGHPDMGARTRDIVAEIMEANQARLLHACPPDEET